MENFESAAIQYYLIAKDDTIIGVGTLFLKWNDKYHQYMYCDLDDVECVQDNITGELYRDRWFRAEKPGADPVQSAEVEMIDAIRYDELYEQLNDGEIIQVIEEPENIIEEPAEEPAVDAEPERKMTIQEMRDKIEELEALLRTYIDSER